MKSPFKHPFWDAYTGYGPAPKCKDERLILDISKLIRSKQDWKNKSKDNTIVQKWKKEIYEQIIDKTRYPDSIIEYVLKELKWYEKIESSVEGFLTSGFLLISDDGHVLSDSAIDEKLRFKLSLECKSLYNSFGADLDYHPNSNNQVIDLVHPSLFPLQYGKTPVKRPEGYEIIEFDSKAINVKSAASFGISKNFQWLPSVVRYNDELKKYEFLSYINNLHPIKYRDLYTSISNVFTAAIPGLNLCLSRASSEQYKRIAVPEYSDAYVEEYHKKMDNLFGNSEMNDLEMDDKYEELESKRCDYVKDLEIKYKGDPKTNMIDLKLIKDLKVIVKLANIELTPTNPSYNGGSWHVEGTINEDIIATILFYYDIDNISESKLSFKKATEDPLYEQNDNFYCEHFYGLHDEDELFENGGSVEAKKGRMVIFPNTCQHHVDPFELVDKTKNGSRKILCFFLVDPYNEVVLATDMVPPQQEQWWKDDSLAHLIPSELRENFKPQSLEQTKKVREQLMSERSINYLDKDGISSLTRSFSLCEH